MKAIVHDNYGSPDTLELREIDTRVPKDNEVLVRVRAAGVHVGDCFTVRGAPLPLRLVTGLLKPKCGVPGFDVAGHVEAVGSEVTRFQVGDEVFGISRGSFAQYAAAAEDKLALKPRSLTFEQAPAPSTRVCARTGSPRSRPASRSSRRRPYRPPRRPPSRPCARWET
jgi:NADPH:quinone reductase-like Zn-dependent oxidoreductase